ncbi:unnamed protein product [Danaus chrysippus]|uniref:(African queen) hypothetical protein n=1 Tax=Danaus chrysippus TaxID=151541 RepID=A0A8J2QZG5_9NEOP|nr:unnamed protein product [Danaus chrysippus]
MAPTSGPSTSTSQKPARKPVIKTVKQTSTKTAVTPTKQRTLRQKKKTLGSKTSMRFDMKLKGPITVPNTTSDLILNTPPHTRLRHRHFIISRFSSGGCSDPM